jgi:hypothetical protein
MSHSFLIEDSCTSQSKVPWARRKRGVYLPACSHFKETVQVVKDRHLKRGKEGFVAARYLKALF